MTTKKKLCAREQYWNPNTFISNQQVAGALSITDTFWISPVVQWIRITCQFRGHRFYPSSRKIPHRSPCTTTPGPSAVNTKAPHLAPMLHNKRNHHSEKPIHHNYRLAPDLHNWRKPGRNEDPWRPKIKLKNNNYSIT